MSWNCSAIYSRISSQGCKPYEGDKSESHIEKCERKDMGLIETDYKGRSFGRSRSRVNGICYEQSRKGEEVGLSDGLQCSPLAI
jgi:hypothetical protein